MTEQAKVPAARKGNWGAKAILILIALLVAVIAYFALAAFLPRWWSQTIGNQVDGNIPAGILAGLFYGFVFTFVPVLVALLALNKRIAWAFKIVLVLLGVALATPNLLTLAIVLGNGNAAHSGERVLDVDAPGFRTASLIAAIVGFAAAILVVVLVHLWRQRGKKVKALKQAENERLRAARNAEKEARDAERAAEGRPTSGPAAFLDDAKGRVADLFDGTPDLDGRPDRNP